MVILTLLSYALAFVAGGLTMRAFPKAGDVLDRAAAALLGRLPKPAEKPLGFGAIERAGKTEKSPRLFSFLPGLPLPFGVPWKLVACVGVAVLILGALHFFGAARYAQGVSEERGRWEVAMRAAEQRASRAELALSRDVAERREQAQELANLRAARLEQVRNDIASASSAEAKLAALREFRERLRNEAAERHARARADYLSGLDA